MHLCHVDIKNIAANVLKIYSMQKRNARFVCKMFNTMSKYFNEFIFLLLINLILIL